MPTGSLGGEGSIRKALQEGSNILKTQGESAFRRYASKNNMKENDMKIVQERFEREKN